MASGHDDTVTYAYTRFWGPIDASEWTFAGVGTESPLADGPCPACYGRAAGGDLLDVSDLAAPTEEPTRWIKAACRCGHAHGNPDKQSCGRYFAIALPAIDAP